MSRALILFITILVAGAGHAQVVINEVCSRNHRVLEDAYGDHPDWVELHNSGDQPMDLTGHHLSDKLDDLARWQMPSIVIPPDAYLILFSGGPDQGALYFGFGISGAGETLFLSDPGLQIIDQFAIPGLQSDHSFGRTNAGPRVFNIPTPGTPNSTPGYLGYAPLPVLDPPSGIHPQEIQVSLSTAITGTQIHYTLDGSTPTEASPLFMGSFQVATPTTVRAIAMAPELLPSEITSGTYLIGIGHDLPIISISTDPDSLFHEEYGIYVLGPDADTTYPYHGANFWERRHIPAHFEYFEKGLKRVSQKVDIRIHGGTSARTKPQRPLRITARSRYGNGHIEYPIFPEIPVNEFKRLVLRNSGGDFCLAHFRDGLFHQIALHNGLDIDVLAFKPAVVYLNGNYWGVLNIRERIDTDKLSIAYGLEKEEILLMEKENESIRGDTIHFHALKEYIRLNDLNDPVHMAHVGSLLDINSAIDYFVLEMYAGNVDWPANNIKYWKPSVSQGKWRYLMYDLDATMAAAGYIPMDINMFQWVFVHREGWTHTEVLRGLLANDEVRRTFINRMADLINTSFSPDRFQHEVDLISGSIASEMGDHFWRWDQWIQVWQDHVQLISEFAQVRPGFVRQHVLEEFGLANKVSLRFDVYPPEGGSITINSIAPEMPFEGVYFNGNPIDVSIDVAEGYTFDHWEYSSDPEFRDPSLAIQRNFPLDGALTAVLRQNGDGLITWPNPVADELTASFNANEDGQARFTIHDTHGRLLLEEYRPFRMGTNRIKVDVSTMASGMFILSMEHGGERASARIVKF